MTKAGFGGVLVAVTLMAGTLLAAVPAGAILPPGTYEDATVVATPSTGLVNGQSVSVSWTLNGPPTGVMAQCDGAAFTFAACDTAGALGLSSGSGSTSFTVATTFTTGTSATVDCTLPASDCRIVAAGQWEPFPGMVYGSYGSALLAFGPEPSDDALRVGDATVLEGDSGNRVLAFPVVLGRPAPSAATFSFATSDAGASAGSDYKGRTGNLTIAAGKQWKIVNVTVLPDGSVEGDESLALTLSSPSAGFTILDATGTGRIEDDDVTTGDLEVAVGDAAGWEGDAGRTLIPVRVVLSAPAPSDTVLTVAQNPGLGVSTTSPSDVTVKLPKTLTFKTGQWKKSFTVYVVADDVLESNERLVLTVSSTTPGVSVHAAATLTILDDE